MTHCYVVGGRFIGAVSSTFAGTADNIAIDDTVTVKGKKNVTTDSYATGGIFGYTNGVTIRNCGFYGKLSGFNHVYGLVGTSWGSKIDVANSFSIGYQPFTVSSPAKSYSTTQEEALQSALAHFQSLYKVDKVYTDTKRTDNTAAYTYEVDGAKTTAYCAVFSFVNLAYKDITGPSALENMPGVPTDVWYATDSYPRTTNWAEYNGDTNLDGQPALTDDLLAVRNQILGISVNNNTDMNRDGEVNVCDLVAMWNKCPTRYKSNGEPYLLKHWMGYKKAKIVYAANDAEAKTAAESFKTKMAEKGLNLAVYADTALSATEYEVLFGNTNRGLEEELGEGIFTVTVSDNGSKVIFSSGSSNALANAVKDFAQFYSDGFAPIITGFHTYEGSVSLKTALRGSSTKNYTAVWGDEFYGADLNQYKWDCNINRSHMGAYPDMVLLDDDETVNVAEGRLRMTAKQYSVDGNEAVKFAAPASVHTKGLMEYKYGYVEIRAKVPFRKGIWPSFWMKADTVLGGRANYDYMVEIDMFEVFGNTSQLASNIHKWYSAQGKAKYGLTDSQTHIMHRDDATGNWLGNLFDKYTNGEDTVNVSGTPEDWHTYGMGWDANYLYMYVDQTLFKRYAISGSSAAKNNFGSDAANRDSDMSGFHDPLYVIFNNHVFTEQASWKPHTITGYESNVPAHYDIDYFRLYQASDAGTALWTK
jgi:beta-glucanase (GH16 family)